VQSNFPKNSIAVSTVFSDKAYGELPVLYLCSHCTFVRSSYRYPNTHCTPPPPPDQCFGRIRITFLDPDPDWECRSGIRIWIQEQENRPKSTKKPDFQPFKNCFLYLRWYFYDLLPTYMKYVYFSRQKPTFCDDSLTRIRIRIPIGLAPWIRIQIALR
jgi:hypothetical protein